MSALRKYLKQPEPDRRVATVAVMHGDHLLMGKRRDNSRWTTPGGHANDGEDLLSAGVRELEEESGIKAHPSELEPLGAPKVVKNDKGETVEVQPFKLDVQRRPDLSTKEDPDAEVARWQWVDTSAGVPDKIKQNLHVPHDRNVLMSRLFAGAGDDAMKDMPNLKKYMKKKGMDGDDTDPKKVDMAKDPKPAPEWEGMDPEGHGDILTDDFETKDTASDPLEDKTGPASKAAESNLSKYQKLKKK